MINDTHKIMTFTYRKHSHNKDKKHNLSCCQFKKCSCFLTATVEPFFPTPPLMKMTVQ